MRKVLVLVCVVSSEKKKLPLPQVFWPSGSLACGYVRLQRPELSAISRQPLATNFPPFALAAIRLITNVQQARDRRETQARVKIASPDDDDGGGDATAEACLLIIRTLYHHDHDHGQTRNRFPFRGGCLRMHGGCRRAEDM